MTLPATPLDPIGADRTTQRRAVLSYASAVPNINEPEWDEIRERPGFLARRARLGYQLGSERLGISLWELEAGECAYPYHYHLTEEEVLIVLEGSPVLRTPDGWQELRQGDVVSFPRGERGGHQLHNRSDGVVRFLAVSTNGEPDLVLYPDSGTVGANERLPGGGGMKLMFREADAVAYGEGEKPPR
jgi:uncharacterized cupin superfamily protein